MEKASSNLMTADTILANGKTTKCMVMENFTMKMVK